MPPVQHSVWRLPTFAALGVPQALASAQGIEGPVAALLVDHLMLLGAR